MTLAQPTRSTWREPAHPFLLALLVSVLIVAAMVLLTVVFGFHGAIPSLQIVPDPAGFALPF
jgi:hypothetical protein